VVLDDREAVQAALHARAIPTAVHYPVPMHRQPAYAHLSDPDGCPVALAMAERVMSLPMGPYLTDQDARLVAEAVLNAAGVAVPAAAEATTLSV
jgi:UDP-2-acetamido-2-deoxy-ribo-hexuluronate aminotransferase